MAEAEIVSSRLYVKGGGFKWRNSYWWHCNFVKELEFMGVTMYT